MKFNGHMLYRQKAFGAVAKSTHIDPSANYRPAQVLAIKLYITLTGNCAMSLTSHVERLLNAADVDAKWFLVIAALISIALAIIAWLFPSTALAIVVLKILGPF